MAKMSAFKFPSTDGQPLHTLSPERVNAGNSTRFASGTTTTTVSSKTSERSESQQCEHHSSPTRQAKASLFADYNPQANTTASKGSGFALPQSPSLPEITTLRSHLRTNSDVQGLVKRFEHLDVRDRDAESSERKRRHEAELRRAQIAREEAESDVMRLREETRRLRREGEEGRDRERRVGRRLEVVMEEFAAAKESYASQSAIYEKEVRKARKEAFKSSSTVLKLQEELKSTRNSFRVTQQGYELEKQRLQQKEQERFEMEYRLIPLQEQVKNLMERLEIAEREKEALKIRLKEDEVATIAAEGLIALPASQDLDDDLLSSPRKASPAKRIAAVLDEDKENIRILPGSARKAAAASEARRLADELDRERMRREQVEELVDFLRMECHFQCCRCQRSIRSGHAFDGAMDPELTKSLETVRESMVVLLTPTESHHTEAMDIEIDQKPDPESVPLEEPPKDEPEKINQAPSENTPGTVDDDRSITFAPESPPQSCSPDDQLHEEEQNTLKASCPLPYAQMTEECVEDAIVTSETKEVTLTVPLNPSTPELSPRPEFQTTPFRPPMSIRTVTTTTTVPMHFTPVSKPPLAPHTISKCSADEEDIENMPPHQDESDEIAVSDRPFDRAAALAAIQYRRGRAKSLARGEATPRKQMMEGVVGRRDISAPALGQKVNSGTSVAGIAPARTIGRSGSGKR